MSQNSSSHLTNSPKAHLLPVELLIHIFSSFRLFLSTTPLHPGIIISGQRNYGRQAQEEYKQFRHTLRNAALTCRAWCLVVIDILYSSPIILMNCHQFILIGDTLRNNPQLANRIKEIAFFELSWGYSYKVNRSMQAKAQEAFDFILSSCSNIAVLSLSLVDVTLTQFPKPDHTTGTIFPAYGSNIRKLLISKRLGTNTLGTLAFRNLTLLYLCGELDTIDPLSLDQVPCLQTLQLHNLLSASSRTFNIDNQTLPPSLTSLECYDCTSFTSSPLLITSPIANSDSRLYKQLKRLVVVGGEDLVFSTSRYDEFTKLEELVIGPIFQYETLAQLISWDRDDPLRFISWPSGLKKLGLWMESNEFFVLDSLKSLLERFREQVGVPSTLERVTIFMHLQMENEECESQIRAVFESLDKLCGERGIEFRVEWCDSNDWIREQL